MSKIFLYLEKIFGLQKSYFQSLGFKLFAFISGALIVCVAMAAFYTINIQEPQMIDEALKGADNVGMAIECAATNYMSENDSVKLQRMIERIQQKTEAIESIRFIDSRGIIKKSTIPHEIGRPFNRTERNSGYSRTLEGLDQIKRARIAPAFDGSHHVINVTRVIYNQPGCASQCHGIHPESQKIVGIFDMAISLDSVNRKISINRWSIAAFFLIMTPIGSFLLFWLLRPVNALIEKLKAVSRGDFKTVGPLPPHGGEVGRLAHSFNRMIMKIRADIEYANLLVENAETFDHKDECEPEVGITQTMRQKEDELESVFPEIYDRISDVTNQKIIRSLKLASLGRLSASIAHEINNPLTAVLSYSSLLLDKSEDPKQKAWLETIVEETKRCRNIVAALLEFARQTTPEKTPTNINDVAERAIGLLQNQESFHNIKIIKDIQSALPNVLVDRGQMYQVFMNLMINAADAMENRGVLTIESRLRVVKSTVADDRLLVEVSVTDTGCGIAQKNIERMFDPFFTTKGPTVGTGLGLSICQSIVKRHNGSISVRSKPGEGATFTVSLPVEERIDENNKIADNRR
ncbi:MAG: ATP-binding protein [Syntrophales bacterium]|jgi:two-component system NtrC family sensor kinase|nr:ATP-binding protein [Syntrophales bacterium]